MNCLLFLQNADFEEPGFLLDWALERKVPAAVARPFAGEPLPPPDSFSHLIVLGCPHSVHELGDVAWLKQEADYLRECLEKKRILGICFGAQLLAHLLGGSICTGAQTEVGWQLFTPSARAGHGPLGRLQKSFPLFQWHSEVFSLPAGAIPLGSSPATALQGFIWQEKVWALAGHPEITPALVRGIAERCWSEDWYADLASKGAADYVQRPEAMLQECELRLAEGRPGVRALLDAWFDGVYLSPERSRKSSQCSRIKPR